MKDNFDHFEAVSFNKKFNLYLLNQLFKSHWLRFVISELNELILGLITYFMTVLMCKLSSIMLSIFGWNERDCDRSA